MGVNRRIFPMRFPWKWIPEMRALLDRIFKLNLSSRAKNSAPRFYCSKRFFLNS